jgi:hypothetical protein
LNAYACGGACTRALLLVVEQATLHYSPAESVRLPERHTAVGLLLTSGPASAITVRQRAGVAEDALDEEIQRLCSDHPDPVVLRGGESALPLTGLWWTLAAGLETWAAQRKRVVLADHDPSVGMLSVAALDLGCH